MALESSGREPRSADPSPKPPGRRNRWPRRILVCLMLAGVGTFFAPTIVALTPLRNILLSAIFKDVNGFVAARSARLNWWSPIAFYGIEISPTIGPPIVTVASFTGDRPLWRLVADHQDLGTFRCDHPHARVVVGQQESNFKVVFARPDKEKRPDDGPPLEGVPRANVGLELSEGSISLERVEGDVLNVAKTDPGRWHANGINFSAGIERGGRDGRDAALVVEPGRLIDHAMVTSDVTYAWLRYIAPLLAGATQTEGTFSIDLDQWTIPLDAPHKGKLGGKLVMHSLDVMPGAVGAAITGFLRLPPALVATQETAIKFQMRDARVYHEGLRFILGGMPVETHGSVGLDQSLDIVAEVTLPHFQNEQAPVRHALAGRKIAIPLKGTLNKPEVDRQALARTGVDILDDVLGTLSQNLHSGASNLHSAAPAETLPTPPEVNQQAPSVTPAQPTLEDTLNQAIPLVEDIIRNRIERRRQQLQQQQQQPSQPQESRPPAPDSAGVAPTPPGPSDIPPRSRRLRQGVRRLLDALAPPEGSQPPPTSTPPPSPSEAPTPAPDI